MSGPKCSKFDLLEAERRRQEEERERRLRELEEARKLEKKKAEVSELKKQLEVMRDEINCLYEEDIEKGRKLFENNYYIDQLTEIKKNIVSDIGFILARNDEVTLESLNILCKDYKNLIFKNKSIIEKPLMQIWMNLLEHIESKERLTEEEAIGKGVKQPETGGIKKFDLNKYEKKTVEEEKSKELLKEFQDTIDRYLLIEDFKFKEELSSLKSATEALASNNALGEEYISEQIKLRLNALKATKTRYDSALKQLKALTKEYEEEQTAYEVLCSMLGKEALVNIISIKYMSLEERLAMLKKDNGSLREELRLKEEAEFISKTVNELMMELGYNIIAEDHLVSSSRKVSNKLYEFENNSAINVFTSDNGSVMFEVTGVDNKKREATSAEKVKLKESMESFCTKYPVIKEKLKDRGIILTKESLMPPDEKYAKITDLSKRNVLKKIERHRQRANPKAKIFRDQ